MLRKVYYIVSVFERCGVNNKNTFLGKIISFLKQSQVIGGISEAIDFSIIH